MTKIVALAVSALHLDRAFRESSDKLCARRAPGEWIQYTGTFFKRPRGRAFKGDLEIKADPKNQIRGKLRFKGLELSAF